MIYNWQDLSASAALAMAISCIVCVWGGFGLDHVAHVSGHVCGVVFRTCVAQLTAMFG